MRLYRAKLTFVQNIIMSIGSSRSGMMGKPCR